MPTPEQSIIKEKIRRLPNRPGVYMMKDRLGRVIYVGKAKSLKKRVSTYFQPSRRFLREQPKIAAMVDMIEDFDILEVHSEAEALLLEGKLIKQCKPRYNTDFTDDKRFLLVRVNIQEALPRFRLTRFRNDHQSLYFGPFAHAGLLRRTLREMRKKFGVLLGDTSPVPLPNGLWQLYNDVRGEIYHGDNVVNCEEYRRRVDAACQFLQGKSREWLAELRSEMMTAAEGQEFEKAADLRDITTAQGGTVVKLLGDGSMLAFTSARAALRAAVEIQQSTVQTPFAVRIGIHTGEVIRTENDLFGLTVNKAARVASVADAGNHDLVDHKRPRGFDGRNTNG